MYGEFYNLNTAPAITDLDHAIDHLTETLRLTKACYDSTVAKWEAFESANAPCSRLDDHQRFDEWFDEWLDSDEVASIYDAYTDEESRLSKNVEWLEDTLKTLRKVLETMTYMDSDGLLPKC